MSGTISGGIQASQTNKDRHGSDFYVRIGAIGGKKGHTGGFAANKELASIAGRRGGLNSRRGGELFIKAICDCGKALKINAAIQRHKDEGHILEILGVSNIEGDKV